MGGGRNVPRIVLGATITSLSLYRHEVPLYSSYIFLRVVPIFFVVSYFIPFSDYLLLSVFWRASYLYGTCMCEKMIGNHWLYDMYW